MKNPMTERTPGPPESERRLATIAAVVVLGAILTVLDATIVSVAIDTLSKDFDAPLSTIQWVMTAYVLALAAVIPLTGWASDRFGGKRVWIASLALFVGGSVLCGLAWSAGSLIAFRVIQGLGGGMVAPTGMSLVAQAAGPRRMGKAMSLIGVPMMLGPVLGPVLGGLLISTAPWQWIFLVNVPVGVLVLLLSARVLEDGRGRRVERLDVTGLVLLSPGLVGLVYAVSRLSSADLTSPGVFTAGIGGLALLGLFARHAMRTRAPLLDLRHFADRTFAATSAVQVLIGATLQGTMLLLPLYYQVVQDQSPLETGLLLVPQGVGAALALAVSGRLVDRGLGRATLLGGLPVMAVGLLTYTQAAGLTTASVALFAMGIGTGCLMAPAMSLAYQRVDRAAIPRATSLINIVQRVGGALGTALCAVVLQHNLGGGATPSDAFGRSFWWPLALVVLAVLPALLLPRGGTARQAQAPRDDVQDRAAQPANV